MHAISRVKEDASIANRYLADQLSDAEREAFEKRLLQDPDAMRDLETTARLKVGLARLRETGELERLVQPRRAFARPLALAMAASVAVLAVGLFVVPWQMTSSPSLLAVSPAGLVDQSGNALRVGSALLLMRTRSAADDAVIAAPPARMAIELRAMPEVAAPSAVYRLELSRMEGRAFGSPIATLAGLRADDQGFVTAYVDSALLSPGRYRLVIESKESSSTTVFVINIRD